jgi:L-malate glycosyltransferase
MPKTIVTSSICSYRKRLCFIGPMVGRHKGRATSQGQILSELFEKEGYQVVTASSRLNRFIRLVDIVRTIVMRRSSVDFVILEVYGGRSFVVETIASWLARRFGLGVVMWLHGGAFPEFMDRYPNWTRRVLSWAHQIVAPSTFLANAITKYGFKARVIPNAINLSDYPYRHRKTVRPRLFWMRSFHPVWNPWMAIRVIAKLRSSEPGATLVMAGQDKGYETEVHQYSREMGLNGAVRFPGFLDVSTKANEGNAADIYINTNRIDNMPVAVVEACAMGMPVITTDVGGINDLLKDGKTGLLVPDDDDDAMVNAVRRLLDEPGLAEQLSANGRQLAERSAWESVRPQWEQIFVNMVTGIDQEVSS